MTCTPALPTCANRLRTCGSTASHRWWRSTPFPPITRPNTPPSGRSPTAWAPVPRCVRTSLGRQGSRRTCRSGRRGRRGAVPVCFLVSQRRDTAGENPHRGAAGVRAQSVEYDFKTSRQWESYGAMTLDGCRVHCQDAPVDLVGSNAQGRADRMGASGTGGAAPRRSPPRWPRGSPPHS